MDNLIFRKVKKEHLSQVHKLLNQLKLIDKNKIDLDLAWDNFSQNTSVNSIVGILDDKIIAYGSIIIENKIRGEVAGHIEDIVVDENYRGLYIGNKLINELVNISKKNNCYRVTLFCKEHLTKFYSRIGFKVDSVNMKKYVNKE